MDQDNKPVLMIITPDDYLVQVGDPACTSATELKNYMMKGYTIKTISFKDYKKLNMKWIWDKPKKTAM